MKKATAKSLAKTAVLDASDKPEDQDEARKRRVKMDFASWRKQTKAGKTTHQEEVGISSAVEIKKAQAEAKKKALEDRAVAKQKAALGKDVKEAKADEEVQLERALDTFEKGEKERIVKGMKKSSKDLKNRYGKDWKSVMYATATKKAKEEGDTSKSDKRYAYEAKVDVGDDVEREEGRNKRKFGTKGNYGHTLVRRRVHRANRGEKKIRGNKEVNVATGKVGKEIGEAKVDTGKTADQKSTARNLRNTPPGADKTIDLKTFITRKPGESLDKARQRVRQGQHAARRGVKEETIDEKFATQYKDKGKLSKTDAPGSRHDHTHDVDPRMADHVPTKKVRKSSKAETRANVLKFDMKKEETIDELNRYEKEKGKSTGSASYRSGVNTPRKGTPTKKGGSTDKIIHFAKGLVRGAEGRPTGQTRRSYDARGKETDRKEKPEFTVTKRRERRARADAAMRDTSGT